MKAYAHKSGDKTYFTFKHQDFPDDLGYGYKNDNVIEIGGSHREPSSIVEM